MSSRKVLSLRERLLVQMQVLLGAVECAVGCDPRGVTLRELEHLFLRHLLEAVVASDTVRLVHETLASPLPGGHRGLVRLQDRVVTVLRSLELESI